MSDISSNDDWYKNFFSGAALDLWRQAKTKVETEQECVFLQEIFDHADGAHLLDLPCGDGRLTLPMVQAGYKITGVDYCQEFLEDSAKAAVSAKLGGNVVQFVHGDMRTVSFEQKFDGAFCLE